MGRANRTVRRLQIKFNFPKYKLHKTPWQIIWHVAVPQGGKRSRRIRTQTSKPLQNKFINAEGGRIPWDHWLVRTDSCWLSGWRVIALLWSEAPYTPTVQSTDRRLKNMEQWWNDNWQATRECSEKIFLQCPQNWYTMIHATSWNFNRMTEFHKTHYTLRLYHNKPAYSIFWTYFDELSSKHGGYRKFREVEDQQRYKVEFSNMCRLRYFWSDWCR